MTRPARTLRGFAGQDSKISVVFDFDGTLAGIRRDPAASRMPRSSLTLLRRLSSRGCRVFILTGRPAAFVERQLKGIPVKVMGFHGNAGSGTKQSKGIGQSGSARKGARQGMRALEKKVRRAVERFSGASVERKSTGFVVHYRNVALKRRGALKSALKGLLFSRNPGFRVLRGRKSFELLLLSAGTKTDALKRLLGKSRGSRVVFVGDDATDFAAMRMLSKNPRFLGIAVLSREASRSPAAAIRVRGITGMRKSLRVLEGCGNGKNRRL